MALALPKEIFLRRTETPNSVQAPDSEVWFDNNQVVGRTTRLAVGGKPLMSGCTMVASITSETTDAKLQLDQSLKPGLFETVHVSIISADAEKVTYFSIINHA